ncbi:MAG TPA: hypothetical protein VGM87_12920 [Roseomonas sp.]
MKPYTEDDVRAILRASQGRRVGGARHGGHASRKHELIGDGMATAPHARLRDLRMRVLGGNPSVSSFRNCLPQAIAYGLNADTGRRALTELTAPGIVSVFAWIAIIGGGFRTVRYSAHDLVMNPSGTDFLPDADGTLGFARPEIELADVLAIKLALAPDATLHIQTAFSTSFQEARLGFEAERADRQRQFFPA